MRKNKTFIPSNSLKSTGLERFAFAFGQVAINIVWLLPGTFLTMYYTDSVGLSTAFMGTMMLICRIFDGFTDIAFGAILDKTKTRWGKARPWILWLGIPTVLSVVALFLVPTSWGEGAKNAYVFITYFFMTSVTYTGINIAGNAILPRFSLTANDRAVTSVIGTLCSLVLIVAMNMIVPGFVENHGGFASQSAWLQIVLIVSVIASVGFILMFLLIKEKVPLDVTASTEGPAADTKKGNIKDVITNKYFLVSLGIFLCANIITGTQAIQLYYARDVFGDANLFGIMSLIGMAPMLVFMPFVPALFKKFGKRNTMMAGYIVSIIALVAMLLNPRNVVWYFVFAFIRGIGTTPATTAVGTLAGDVVDFTHWKNGVRSEGIAVSVQSIGAKLGTGIGSAVLGWMLSWGGYNAALTAQSGKTQTAIIIVTIGLPLLVTLLNIVLLLLWDIEKYKPEVEAFIAKNVAKENEL